MTATTHFIITEQEYLKLEEKATVRHEFINGKLYEMPGGTLYHGVIISNLIFLFRLLGLKAIPSDIRVQPPNTQDYYYPDVVVTAEKVTKAILAKQPMLIAEVLSPSTRTNDLTDKFIAYRQFTSLTYYLLVEPDFCYATLFSRNEDGIWESEVYNQLSSTILLPKLAASLALTGIYEDLEWVATPS